MDHLPAYLDSRRTIVPCLCPDGYDGDIWAGFPARCGWDLKKLASKDHSGHTHADVARFLQAWLYFGLLAEVFGPMLGASFDQHDFIQERAPSVYFVTTAKLPDYVRAWEARDGGATAAAKQARFEYVRERLLLVRRLAQLYCYVDPEQHKQSPESWPLSPEIALSIVVLGDTLTHAGFQILGRPFNIDWGTSRLLVEQMVAAGWCPRATATCLRGQQIHNLVYASTVEQPRRAFTHEAPGCTELVCQWDQVDAAGYKTQHRPECEGCALAELSDTNLEKVISIIANDGIPLIQCDGSSSSIRLHIQDNAALSAPDNFVALSHVWAQGLGNPLQNALFSCQIIHIQNLASQCFNRRQDSEKTFWWCDTICVPVGAAYTAVRNKAIREMAKIYSRAAKVLVIDESLSTISMKRPAVELYIRLKLSSWMGRLWTLQEGVLAKEAHIQFSDGTRTMQELEDAVIQEAKLEHRYLYQRYSFLCKTFFAPFIRDLGQQRAERLTGLWKTIQYRSTSHREDEATCFCLLFGLDPGPVLDLDETDYSGRMASFFKQIAVVPMRLIYQPAPRLPIPGFRWAPASFVNHFRGNWMNPFAVVSGVAELRPGEEGLVYRRPGLIAASNTCHDVQQLFESIFTLDSLSAAPSRAWSMSWLYAADKQVVETNQKSADQKLVIILEHALDKPGRERESLAILAYLRESQRRDDCMDVDYLTPVSFVKASTSANTLNGIPLLPVSEDQEWALF